VSTRGACRRTAPMEQSPIRLRRPPKLRNAGGSTTLRSPRRRAYLVVVPDRDPRGPGGDRAAARWAIGVFRRVEGSTVPDRPSSRCTPCSDSITRLRRVADFLDFVRRHMPARARALWTCSSRTARDATSWKGQTVAMMGVLAMIAVAGEPHRRLADPCLQRRECQDPIGAFPEIELNMPAEKFHHDVQSLPDRERCTGNFKAALQPLRSSADHAKGLERCGRRA